jgi:DNA-binding transcriptional LysR family regulator
LRIYGRVAELASFSAAAASLGLPKATVSTAVQRLEAALGTRLLHRTTRRVSMTHDGRTVFERGRDLVDDVDELRQHFRGDDAALAGRLRVDMPLAIAREVVVPRLPEFLRAHPKLEIELSSTDRRVDLVREGFDCVLRVGTLGDTTLVARPLGEYRIVNCASREYVARHGVPRSLAALSRHRLVHYAPVLGSPPDGFEYADPADPARSRYVAMDGSVTVNNSDAYLGACLAGLGIVQVPEAGVREPLADGRLVQVLPKFRPPPMPVSLVYAHRRHLPRRVQVFMAWIGAVLADRLSPRRAAR